MTLRPFPLLLLPALLTALPLHGGGWTNLLADGLAGWEPKPDLGQWTLTGGTLTGVNADGKRGSELWTTAEYGDFALEGEFRFSGTIDSGVFVKSGRYQVNIGQSSSLKVDKTLSIYAPGDDRGKYPGEAEGVAELLRVGDWNRFRIEARGDRIIVMLNGREVLDYETLEMPPSGPIGLQVHGGLEMKIEFRALRVKTPGDA